MSQTTATAVTQATSEDAPRAIGTLTLAFATDPLLRWFYPEPLAYLRSFPEMMKYFGGGAFEHGSAYQCDGFLGAALWLPPGVSPDEERMGQLIQESTDERIHESVFAMFEQMEEHHPQDPVWYLPVIGVDPTHQGQGIGSRLLRAGLAVADRDGTPAYLESSNPRNVPLYEKHGFEVVAEIQAGDSPPIWPMLRQPR